MAKDRLRGNSVRRVAAALAFMVTGTQAPSWVTNTTGLLGVPMA